MQLFISMFSAGDRAADNNKKKVGIICNPFT